MYIYLGKVIEMSYTLSENVLIPFDSGVFKTWVAEMMNISREEVCEIIDGVI